MSEQHLIRPGGAPLLGLPGDLVAAADGPTFQATKAGGWAELPGPRGGQLSRQLRESATCGVCNARLSLIIQAHAPLGRPHATRVLNDRVLYVFGCIAEGCGLQSSCWRAFRAQENHSPFDGVCSPTGLLSQSVEPTAAHLQPQLSSEDPIAGEGDPWGTGAGMVDWGASPSGFPGPSEIGSSAPADFSLGKTEGPGGGWAHPQPAGEGESFNFDDLDAALDGLTAASAQTAGGEVKARHTTGAEQRAETGADIWGEHVANPQRNREPALAEFYIFADVEPGQDKDEARLTAADKEHAEALMAQYEQDEGAASAEATGAAGQGSSQAPVESWAGEAYEDDATVAVDATAMRFLKRLQRCPSQCVRYSFAGQVMWPTSPPPSPEPCGACGEPRVFEMQLMAPLVHYLEEAAQWAEEGGRSPETLLRTPSSWAWASVAVYVCSKSCPGRPQAAISGHSVTEEWVALSEE